VTYMTDNGNSSPHAVCILGMHRSGTSFVTRLLNFLGYYLGEETDFLEPSQRVNPEGFWELKDILAINNRILWQLESSWDTVVPPPRGWEYSDAVSPAYSEILTLVREKFSKKPYWAWKDPRSGITFPLWKKAVSELHMDLRCVLIIRNPLDVAISLKRRECISIQKSLAMWLNQSLLTISALEGLPVSVIHYDNLITDWESELFRAVESLHLICENRDLLLQRVKTFLRRDLRHSVSSLDDLVKVSLIGEVGELYQKIITFGEGHLPFAELMSYARSLLDRAPSDYHELWASKDRVAEMQSRTDELLSAIKDKDTTLGLMKSQHAALENDLKRLSAIEASVTWKVSRRILDYIDYSVLPLHTRSSKIVRSLFGRSRELWSLLPLSVMHKPSFAAEKNKSSEELPENKVAARGISKISFLVSPHDAQSKRYRVYNPIEELSAAGINCRVFHESDADQLDVILDCNVLIVSRIGMNEQVRRIMGAAHEKGIPLVFDIDDLVFDPDFIQYFDGLHHMPEPQQKVFVEVVNQLKATLLECDYCTCTAETLRNYIERMGKKAYVIRNSINNCQYNSAKQLLETRLQRKSKKVIIGYFSGTNTHNKDFLEASSALVRILRDYPFTEFHIVGPLDIDERFRAFGDRVVRRPFMHYLECMEYQSLMDIGIAPLALNNPFTDSKSELKIFEAALVEVPVVASPVVSYAQCISDGVDGMLARSTEEWYNKLSLLIEDPLLRRQLGKTARLHFVDTFYIKNVIVDIVRTYEEIVAQHKLRG